MLGRPAVIIVLLALVAGCVNPLAAQQESAPWQAEREAFLHSAMTLATQPEPQARAVAMRPFFQAWAAGDDYPTWAMDPLGEDALVTSMQVKLFLRATGPVVESGRFPDVMVYVGSSDAWMGFASITDATAYVPGEVYEADLEIALPQGGLWLGPDDALGVKVVPVMLQQEQANLEVLLGEGTPSGARFVVERLALARGDEVGDAWTGEVVGTIYAGPAAPATTHDRQALALPAGTTYLLAWMNTTENVGVPDIDLSVEAPDGTVLASSGTPTPREAIRIAGPNLVGPGEYALVVTTAGSPRAEYALEWRAGIVA